MLRSLAIRNFVLIEDATVDFVEGLNILSGETGAGKTLLTQALELLLGERAGEGLVGSAGDDAVIQAEIDLSEADIEAIPESVVDLAGLREGQVLATRRLSKKGRNRCYLNDTAVNLRTLQEALGRVISFSGQHEHRRLVESKYQRNMLDAFSGDGGKKTLQGYRRFWEDVRSAARELETAQEGRRERKRESELLQFQVQELSSAQLSVEEEESLLREQRRLSRAEELLRATAEAATILRSEEHGPDVIQGIADAHTRVAALEGVHDGLDQAIADLAECTYVMEDVARRLHSFSDTVQVDPARLEEVDSRLGTFVEMARKYGGTVEAAVSYLEKSSARLHQLETAEEDLEGLRNRHRESSEAASRVASELTEIRTASAAVLEKAVKMQLEDLGMPDAAFCVQVLSSNDWADLGEGGADKVEFRMSANRGQDPKSLARVGSGGELSRALLALKAALAGLERSETMVLDEIDAGVGGRIASAVGRKLHELAENNQLIVVTHLPQLAAFAATHYLIEKTPDGDGTVTRLRRLDERESLEELSRMMGGEPGEVGALAHARELRDRAASGLID